MKIILSILIIIVLAMTGFTQNDSYLSKREAMVKDQIQARGVKDARLLDAMRLVPREKFVAEESQSIVYGDFPVPIGFDQTISQPYIVALMTEELAVKPTDKVLEIGTGCGYQTAILGELAGNVFSVETVGALAQRAEKTLTGLGYKNISFKTGDGFDGWKDAAPFDAIIVTAAPSKLPSQLLAQLKIGGRMVVPVGTIHQELFLITKTKDGFDQKSLGAVRFVPMVGNK